MLTLNDAAEPVANVLSGVKQLVGDFGMETYQETFYETHVWNTNWKVLAENFMEGYHLTPVHRKTLHPMTPTRLCENIPGGTGYTGYKSHYNNQYKGRTQVHPEMTEEEKSQSMMVWIYPSFVAAISPNSAVYMSITPTGPSQLQTRWNVVAREEVFASGESQARHEFAKSFNLEDRERLVEVQKGLQSRFATRGYLAPPDFEGCVWDFYEYMAKSVRP